MREGGVEHRHLAVVAAHKHSIRHGAERALRNPTAGQERHTPLQLVLHARLARVLGAPVQQRVQRQARLLVAWRLGGPHPEALHAAIHPRGNQLIPAEVQRGDAALVFGVGVAGVLHEAQTLVGEEAPETDGVVATAGNEKGSVGRGGQTRDLALVTLEC